MAPATGRIHGASASVFRTLTPIQHIVPRRIAGREDEERRDEVVRLEEPADDQRLDGRHEAGRHVHGAREHAGVTLADVGGGRPGRRHGQVVAEERQHQQESEGPDIPDVGNRGDRQGRQGQARGADDPTAPPLPPPPDDRVREPAAQEAGGHAEGEGQRRQPARGIRIQVTVVLQVGRQQSEIEVAAEAEEAVHQPERPDARRPEHPPPGDRAVPVRDPGRAPGLDQLPLAPVDLGHLPGLVAEPGPEDRAPDQTEGTR